MTTIKYKGKERPAMFNLVVSQSDFYKKYNNLGKHLASNTLAYCKNELESYINDRGELDMSKIENDWFPEIDAQVFISHSHNDHTLVHGLMGWFNEEYGLNAFADFSLWGYSNDLLKAIDNVLSIDKPRLYDYSKRNKTTSMVHLLLNGALMKMIDKADYFVFVNTDKSLSLSDSLNGMETHSPWIYSELLIANTIRKKTNSDELIHADGASTLYESIEPAFPASLDRFININPSEFKLFWDSKLNYTSIL